VLKIEDDDGIVHKDHLPNSYYVLNTKGRLLSPQNWSRELRKQGKKGAHSRTDYDRITLNWLDGSKKTVLLDPVTASCRNFLNCPRLFKVHCILCGSWH
jgi:hypothetical protein